MNERFSDSTTSSTFEIVGETLNISSSVWNGKQQDFWDFQVKDRRGLEQYWYNAPVLESSTNFVDWMFQFGVKSTNSLF